MDDSAAKVMLIGALNDRTRQSLEDSFSRILMTKDEVGDDDLQVTTEERWDSITYK